MAKVKNRLARIAGYGYDSDWDPYAYDNVIDDTSNATTTYQNWYATSDPGVYQYVDTDGVTIWYDTNTGLYEDSNGTMWYDNATTSGGTKTPTTNSGTKTPTTNSSNTANTIVKAGQSVLSILSSIFGGGSTSKATTATGSVLNTAGTTTTNIPLIIGVGVLAAIFITKQMDK